MRIADGPFGSDLKVTEYQPSGIPLLRVSNIRTGEVEGDFAYISDEKHEQLKRSKVYPNDVLLTKAGAILGYSAVFPHSLKEGNITSHLVTITCRADINPHYLSHFFRSDVGQMQIYRWGNKSTRPELNTSEVKNIFITIPPLAVQDKIVKKLNKAYAAKKEKEAEAQRLLEGIDGYLLSELGIELPAKEENNVQKRVFQRPFREVLGNRFDAPIYHKQYSLHTQRYPMARLQDCALINPTTTFSALSPETFVTFIPMEKVTEHYGEADVSDSRPLKEAGGYTKFQDEDLLWAKITPCMQNGKSAVVSTLQNGVGFGSTEYHVFRAKPDIDIRYIHAILRLQSLRKHAMLYFSGSAGHQRVSDEFFKRLNIPKPSLQKQQEIVNYIAAMRARAKQLRQEAEAELAQAKQAVEAMILGQ